MTTLHLQPNKVAKFRLVGTDLIGNTRGVTHTDDIQVTATSSLINVRTEGEYITVRAYPMAPENSALMLTYRGITLTVDVIYDSFNFASLSIGDLQYREEAIIAPAVMTPESGNFVIFGNQA